MSCVRMTRTFRHCCLRNKLNSDGRHVDAYSARVASMWQDRILNHNTYRTDASIFKSANWLGRHGTFCQNQQDRKAINQHGDVRNYCSSTTAGPDMTSRYETVHIPDNTCLAHYILENFPKYGDLIALVNGETGQTFTYGQLLTNITRVGSALRKLGFQPGDVATVFSPNCPEYAVVFLAISAIGGIVSAVNPVYTSDDLHHSISFIGSKLLITTPELLPVAKRALQKNDTIKEVITIGNADGYRPLSRLLEDDGSSFPENLDLDSKNDLAALPFSSGTTGLPKSVMLTHHNIISNVQQLNSPQIMGAEPGQEVYLGLLPFYHIYGQVVVMLLGLRQGSKIVTLPKFQPETFLRSIQDQKVSSLHVAPPLVVFLAKYPQVENYDLSLVHTLFSAAAPLGEQLINEALGRIGQKSVRQLYGLTETSPVTHCNPITGYKYASIGQVVCNTEHKLVSIETSQQQPVGEDGELCIRGPQVMKGYYQNPKATADTIDAEGWLHTGDIGHMDEEGFVYIVDRLKELIKVKGFQVAPAELENLLLRHDAVADAAVIGIPDERAGEIPRAYVVLKPNIQASEQALIKYVEENVAPFKQLRGGVEFRPEIPKTASGKILRRQLKTEYQDMMK